MKRAFALLTAALLLVFAPACAQTTRAPAADTLAVAWSWTGGVTENSAVITARLPAAAQLKLAGRRTPLAPALTAPMANGTLHRFTVAGLKPDTVYRYTFGTADGAPLDSTARSFRTFPVPGKPASFRFAVGSCAKGIGSPVFTAAAKQNARFFLHTGDFHYNDIAENNIESFRFAYDTHLSAAALRDLLATTPLLYQWDDHDFGPNNSNRTSPSREASLRNYRELVPHYPLTLAPTDPLAPTDQSFAVGRVHFILSDLRSQRDPDSRRMMNAAQDAWLHRELLAARDAGRALIVWVSSVPWSGPASNDDRWQGYAAHRAEIADFIKAHNLASRIVILSGDAHMTAIDDGQNSDFATGGGAPLRVLQAGPIANRGSYKGGPYSHGAAYRSENGSYLQQFALVDIHDDGKTLRVKWSARDGSDGLGDKVLSAQRDAEGPIELEFTVPPPER